MNIVNNLQYLETHYLKVWIQKWRTELEASKTEEERARLQTNIEKAKAEIAKRSGNKQEEYT